MHAQASAQLQVNQLQNANHEAQAYWDNKSQIMMIVAQSSAENPEGARGKVEDILKTMNQKYPKEMRQLASEPSNIRKFQRRVLRSFRTDLLTTTQLEKFHVGLGQKLMDFYSQEGDQIQKTEIHVKKGQTLIKISAEYYQTPRRWTEIYLANQGRLQNWNLLSVGMPLDVYLRKEARLSPIATKKEDQ